MLTQQRILRELALTFDGGAANRMGHAAWIIRVLDDGLPEGQQVVAERIHRDVLDLTTIEATVEGTAIKVRDLFGVAGQQAAARNNELAEICSALRDENAQLTASNAGLRRQLDEATSALQGAANKAPAAA